MLPAPKEASAPRVSTVRVIGREMRKPKQRWHLEFSKLFGMLLVTAILPSFLPGNCLPGAFAQDMAGPSFSGSDSGNAPGMVGSSGASGYSHSAPSNWGNRGGAGGGQGSYLNQQPAVGFAAGHSGYANGGNNGSQSAVKLPASNCCGKLTRNSGYYSNEYSGYMDSFMRNATSNGASTMNASNSMPGINTTGGGAAFARNAGRGMNGMPGQMFVPGQQMGVSGQMSAPGQVAVPGQVPGSI